MNKREAQATIDELAAECNRLQAENEQLRTRLAAVVQRLRPFVRDVRAYYSLCIELEQKSRK